jgi:enoyl-CoA hydratase/carnithine racemase
MTTEKGLTAMTDTLLARKDGRVGVITFNNPAKHNAMSLEMWEATVSNLEAFAADAEVRVLVLTGAGGKAFVSGADISKFENERSSKEGIERYNLAVERGYAAVHSFPKPTIAMIRGYCIGGGMGLAACADIRICSPHSRFAIPAAKLGLGYDYPGVKRLVDLVGPSFAKEIFFTARQFDAAEAREMGFANRIVPDEEIEAYVRNYAETIAGNAPLTVNSIKFIVGETVKDESKRDLGRCSELVAQCFASKDYVEGVEGRQAFMEKRKPVFTGA